MLVTLGSLSLLFAYRMAPQAKEVEMLSTEELQRNHQLISKIYTLSCQLIHERPLKLASRNGLMRIQHRPFIVEGTHLRLNRRHWLLRTELECIELIVM